MKKYIPLLIAAAIFAGCSNTVPAAQPEVFAESVDTFESTRAVTSTAPSDAQETESSETSVSEKGTMTEPAITDNNAAGANDTEQRDDEVPLENNAPVTAVSIAEVEETAVTYPDGSPRFNDPDAIRDVEMSESRRYLFTNDEGENGCAPGEVIHYATIPVGDDMPEYIELINVDTDEHAGFMYDDGNFGVNGDKVAGDGIYSIKITYDLNKGKTWSPCYFGLYTDSEGNTHTGNSLTFVNIENREFHYGDELMKKVQERIEAVTTSDEYFAADIDGKEQMLLDELDLLADEGLVYRDLTRTNSHPRNVVYKVVDGPTVVIELEVSGCYVDPEAASENKVDLGYDPDLCDGITCDIIE
ncbi:MAG: hypothetical protein II782_07115 [Oscillospiraceae bacterium]|nr:hypothetical protein [Oscillospiraceae bacterium]